MQATITVCDSSMATCASQQMYSLQAIRDLDVMVDWQNLAPGTHTQRISFVLPSGDLYTAYERSFAVADGATGATTTQTLPVVGTWIARRRLTGTWNLTLELDGVSVATQAFEVAP